MPSRDFLKSAAWWLLPVVFLFWLYWDGLLVWFLADDFAWLGLLRQVHSLHDLLYELFTPMAQGTIRPWSERGFFMLLQGVFGLDALPFRTVVFLTAAADVVLVAWITLRLTGSRMAGFLAPVFWVANGALVRVMTWSSAYNEMMCPLFLLGALALFIRYAETGKRPFWWWQLVVFSLGFGALEINIVYPAVAAAWVIFGLPTDRRRSLLGSIVPLAGISVIYFAVHRWVAPLPVTGPYVLRFDTSIFKTIALYWKWSFVPEPMQRFGHGRLAGSIVLLLGSLTLAGWVVNEIRRRRYLALFFLSWYVLTLAPMLPLAAHRTDYYLTIPVIGLAMLGGAGLSDAWRSAGLWRVAAVVPVLAYLWLNISVGRAVSDWWLAESLKVRTLVLGVEAARETHPKKAIVLDGVTSDLFNLSIGDSAFAAAGISDVYLTPGSELTIQSNSDTADLEAVVLEPGAMRYGVTHDEVVVYSMKRDGLRNITAAYSRSMSDRPVDQLAERLPSRIDGGNFLYSWLLGPTWLHPESGFRWMPGAATLRLGVPVGGATKLELSGYIPETQLLQAPRHLMVLADGVAAGETRIYSPESEFHRLISMSAALAGKSVVNLEIRVDPVDRRDGQEYGVVFGKIAIRP